MRYFQQFPTVAYRTTEIINELPQQFVRSVPNMGVRFKFDDLASDYQWYQIVDRDRPDTLAAQWYGSSEYTWVVLLSNDMKDMYDWPMGELEFYTYMNRKYESPEGTRNGVVESQATVHQYLWTDPTSELELEVDATLYATKPETQVRQVSVYDYENDLNDKRRDIKRLIQPAFQSFVAQFSQLVKF